MPRSATCRMTDESASNDPSGQQQDPDDPDDGQDDTEETEPVYLAASVSPSQVVVNTGTTTLTWEGENATYCHIDGTRHGDIGTVTVGPWTTTGTKSIRVECWGIGDSQYAQIPVEVSVISAPAQPKVTLTLNPEKVAADTGTSTLSWSSENATSCTGNGTAIATSGSVSVGPYSAGTRSFTVSCTGPGVREWPLES